VYAGPTVREHPEKERPQPPTRQVKVELLPVHFMSGCTYASADAASALFLFAIFGRAGKRNATEEPPELFNYADHDVRRRSNARGPFITMRSLACARIQAGSTA
jgi:hypothetical protein